eukprot:2839738-Rhodomonas_salina.1
MGCTGLLKQPSKIPNLDPSTGYNQYWQNQLSSHCLGRSEIEAWTDGSRQLLPTEEGGKALF